jgi:hypothetical protein
LNNNGVPIVHSITEFVFERFPDDDKVFKEFCCGRHNLQLYSGDIASQHEQEAEVAENCLSHRLPRIKEWAIYEIEESKREAQRWRKQQEESDI